MKHSSLLVPITILTLAEVSFVSAQISTQKNTYPKPKSIELANRKVVASWPKTVRSPGFIASRDSAHVAWTLGRDGITYLAIDGKEKVLGPSIRIATPQWSQNSKRVALKVWKGTEESMFLDDKIGGWYERVQGGRFTTDHKLGYSGLKAGKWFQIIDGVERQSLVSSTDEVKSPDTAIFSVGNSKFFAVKYKKDGKSWFVVNGKKQEEYTFVSDFYFSPDGQHYAYVAQNDSGVNLGRTFKQCYVIDGVVQPFFDEVGTGLGRPSWSPDGKTIAYPIKTRSSWFVGQHSLKPNQPPGPLQPHFKPEQSIEEFLKAREAAPQPGWHDSIENPVWSADSKQMGYLAKHEKKMVAVVNRQAGPLYDYISSIELSPKGNRAAYVVWQTGGKRHVVIDGKQGLLLSDIYPMVWSPDGTRFAYKAERNRKQIVIIDGQESEEYEKVGFLTWSPDSRHLAYTVVDQDAPAGTPDSYTWWKEMMDKQPNFGNKLVVDEVATSFIVDPMDESYPAWADSKTINVLMLRGAERSAGESADNHYLDALSLKVVE